MDKILEIIKSKWKETMLVVLVGVVSTLLYKVIEARVTITAYENQEKSLKTIIKTLETTKAKEKTVIKYVKGDVVEKIIYKDILVKKDTDSNTNSKSKVVLPDKTKTWAMGLGYDVCSKDLYGQIRYTFFDTVYIETEYPVLFDGVNRVRISVGIKL